MSAHPIAERLRGRRSAGPSSLAVCVLTGGNASERIVSLSSGIAVTRGLLARGHRVLVLDPATGIRIEKTPADGIDDLAARLGAQSGGGLTLETLDPEEQIQRTRRIVPALAELDADEIDVVVSVLHGGAGEGGAVPAMLDLLGLPYVGSDPIASAVAMDKALAKSVFREVGIPLPEQGFWLPNPSADIAAAQRDSAIGSAARWEVLKSRTGAERADESQERAFHVETGPVPGDRWIESLGGYPLVVKPLAEGSTVGVTIVNSAADWAAASETGRAFTHPTRGLIVERFIPGREITVAVVDGEPLPVVEIAPGTGFYDFTRKYTKGETQYRVPAPIDDSVAARIAEDARLAYEAIGCRDVARVDFRLDPSGVGYCLEVNTLPGMTDTSLVPMAARAVGIEFDELLDLFCRCALRRQAEFVE